jgi:hypothetical protein
VNLQYYITPLTGIDSVTAAQERNKHNNARSEVLTQVLLQVQFSYRTVSLGLICPEDEVNSNPQNVGNYLPIKSV